MSLWTKIRNNVEGAVGSFTGTSNTGLWAKGASRTPGALLGAAVGAYYTGGANLASQFASGDYLGAAKSAGSMLQGISSSIQGPAGSYGQLFGVGGSSDALGLIGLKNQQDQWNKAYEQANNQFNQSMAFNQDSFNKSFNLAQSQYDNSNMWQQKEWDYNTDAAGRGADAAAYTNAFVSGLKPAEMLNGDHINPWEMMGIPGGASAGTTLAADATSGAGSMQQAKGQAQMAMGGALQQAAATQTALSMKKADIDTSVKLAKIQQQTALTQTAMNNQTALQATDMNNKTSIANTVATNQQSAANVQTQMAPEFSYMDDKRQLIRGQAQSAYAQAAATGTLQQKYQAEIKQINANTSLSGEQRKLLIAQATANYANAHFADVNATNAGEARVDVDGTIKGTGIQAHGTPSQIKGAWDRLTGK